MGLIGTIISWIVFGLVVGLIARALYPGRQKMGIPNTIALGIAGSLIGGAIAWAMKWSKPEAGPFEGAGWIASIVCAMLVVWAATAMSRRSGDAGPPRIDR